MKDCFKSKSRQIQLNTEEDRHHLNQGRDSENELGFSELLKILEQPFDFNRFTLKYKDIQVEEEFKKSIHEEGVFFAKMFVFQWFIILTVFIAFQTYKLVLMNGAYPNFKWALISAIISLMIPTIHLLLMRKFKWLTQWFTVAQTIVTFVVSIEMAILGNPSQVQVDGFTCLVVALTYISCISYCQRELLFSYLTCILFLIARSYFWIEDRFRYARFNIFFTLTFTFIYIFSRAFHQRERQRFQQSQQQIKLLKLFDNLIRVYHDGIIITSDEQIVFSNKQISQIFQLDNQNNQDSEQVLVTDHQIENKPQVTTEDLMIKEFQKAYPSDNQQFNNSITLDNLDEHLDFSNIWEYILQHKYHVQDFLSGALTSNPLDGTYFNYNIKTEDNREQEKKKLQVFTQILSVGSRNLVLSTIRDMSQWLELERQKSLSEMKTIAFASAAHEFRNPLNAIVSSLNVLENLVDKNQGSQYFLTAKNCSQLMLHLVNDILDFSQIESNTLVPHISECNMRKAVGECIGVLIFKAQSKGINLYADIDPSLPQIISTDSNRLIQILINLLSNAIKYTAEGYVKVSGKKSPQQNSIFLTVEDTGVGIEESKISMLFTPFTKIMNNRHMNYEGVGLGLTISKNIALALNGDLLVQSQLGKGSKFMLILPIDGRKLDHSSQDQLQQHQSAFSDSYTQSCNFVINEDQHQLQSKFKNLNTKRNDVEGLTTRNVIPDSNHQSANDIVIEIASEPHQFEEQKLTAENDRYSLIQSQTERSLIIKRSMCKCECSRILIVDDEPFNLIALEGLLQQFNQLKVDKSFNPKEALKMIEANTQQRCLYHQPYKMIFLDKYMPVMNGIGCAKEIRSLQLQGKLSQDLTLILVTGDENALKSEGDEEQANGRKVFDDVLLKPIDLNNLNLLLLRYNIF